MIEDHPHCYSHVGEGLFSKIFQNKAVQEVGKKLLTSALDQGAKTAGEYIGEEATKGLLQKLLA